MKADYKNPKKLHFGHLSHDSVDLMFNCIFCQQTLETASIYEKHDKDNHVRDNEYFCPENGCTFQDESKMKVMHHFTKEHKNVTLRVCSLCKEGFLTNVLLKRHVLDAHRKKIDDLTCPTCFEKFKTIDMVRHHVTRYHIYGNFKCDRENCKKEKKGYLEFENKADFEDHYKRNHEVLDSYTCEICGEKFTGNARRSYYKKHMELHSKTEKNFKCKDCDKKFFLECDMKAHWLKSHKEKKLLCSQCNYMARYRNHLKQHMEIHNEELPFQCDICSKRFTRKIYLQNHIVTHSDVRAFNCEFCGKSFKQSKNLFEHRKIHTGKFAVHCKICNKGFAQKYNLKLHNDKHHPDIQKEVNL